MERQLPSKWGIRNLQVGGKRIILHFENQSQHTRWIITGKESTLRQKRS